MKVRGGKKRSDLISVFVDLDLHMRIKTLSEKRGRLMRVLVAEAIEEWLKKEEIV